MVAEQTVHTGHQGCLIGKVGDTDRTAADFVFIGRANATTGGANFGNRGFALAGTIKLAVHWQDQRRIFGNHQVFWRNINALLAQLGDFHHQMPRVQHHAIANHRQLAAAHNA